MTEHAGSARESPDVRRLVGALVEHYRELNSCRWHMGKLFIQVQEKFARAGGRPLTDADLENETRLGRELAERESALGHRIGAVYNDLRRRLGEDEDAIERFLQTKPPVSPAEARTFGRIAERFSEAQTVTHRLSPLVDLVDYAALNGLTLDADPGELEVSLLQPDGRWMKRRFAGCDVEQLHQTVVALKVQRGIPVEEDGVDRD